MICGFRWRLLLPLMPSAFVPDGLFAVVLSLRLFERPLLAAGDYQETVHANGIFGKVIVLAASELYLRDHGFARLDEAEATAVPKC